MSEGGDIEAQFRLGQRYALGIDTEYNPKEAYIWFHLAAEKGSAKALLSRYEISQHLTQDQIADAKLKVAQLLKR